jgi:glycosyltransferase involved in cell wall biosynthesis
VTDNADALRLTVILPAYNEERTIGPILDALSNLSFDGLPRPVEMEIIVVDDASKDNTDAIAAARPEVKLIRHERNQGKGAAIHTALKQATGDVVVIQDADMEYSVKDYPKLLRPFMEEDAQVVYGSRFLTRRRPKNMRFANWLANRILTLVANVLYGAHLTDEATCYKVFRTPLLKSLPLRAGGFDFCPEVTALVRLRGISIHEVPVEYAARTVKEGKKVRWTDGLSAIRTLLAYRFRRG